MISRSTQAAVAGIIGLGVVLSACSPPNENPSDRKVDTATEFVAAPTSSGTSSSTPATLTVSADLPGVIDCVGTPEHAPDSLSLSCTGDDDRVVDIEWTDWDEETAVGTATRETRTAGGSVSTTDDVEVELSDPVAGSGGEVFSTITVDGRDIVL